jgi:glycosyltransferase involved in cell wall biosynthesis
MFKRITFLISSLACGGAENVCVTLANQLVLKGWRVEIVVLHLVNSVNQHKLSKKIRVINLNTKKTRLSFFALFKYAKSQKPDKFLVFSQQLAVLLVIIRYLYPFDFQIFSRNISNLTKTNEFEVSIWHKYFVNFFVGILYRKVDFIVAQSVSMKNDLIRNYGIDEKQISTIYNPLTSKVELMQRRGVSKFEREKSYLLCVGRLEKVKAFHIAIKVFSKLTNDFPGLRLKIVGEGSCEKSLRKVAKDCNVSALVDFEGYSENLVPYYLNASVTLLTSLYEGFPNVLIESIALGTPAVAFDCPSGPAEIIINGQNGILCEYMDEVAFEKAIRTALTTNWVPQKISATAEKFCSGEIVEKYLNVITKQI